MPVLYKSSPHVTPIFSTSLYRVSSLLTNPQYQSSSSSLSSTSIFLRLRSVQGSKSMDLEVLGRHALLFDDDATSAFVNSNDALVEWNSLLIDRYDVRHLLPTPLPPLKRRRHHSSVLPAEISELELELDQERFLDLPPPSDEQELDNGLEKADAAGYHTVAFSYGNPDGSADQKNADAGSDTAFHPPFPVPENLLNNLPPTEKLHQIIARTAMFVRKHGGQSEIILRVKQGDNPTFGFLMSDHHLHAYFRFLVDHQELLESDLDGKSEEEKKADNEDNRTGGVGGGGALSLLGSVYGSGEDEEGTNIDSSESQENDRKETSVPANTVVSHCSEGMVSSMNIAGNDEAIPKHLPPKEKAPVSKRNRVASTVKGGTASNLKKKGEDLGSLGAAMGKSQTSALPSTSKVKTLVLEPPSDLKRLVDKIVEFILKNGKEFEAVLVEQDNKHGRFPFLLPSNQYYPYYLQVLQKAQESKLTGKNLSSEKDGLDKRTASSNDAVSLGSSYHDMPYDSDRKEKFKMVLSKSKKDGQDHPSKPTQQQVGVSVDAAAAILQAATRGIRNPNLDILPRTSSNGFNHGLSSEGGQASSFQSLFSSQPHSSSQKSDPNGGPSVSVPVAKAIANTAALAAASEADSSEAHLTKEQKLKAERLKRAKMFAAIIKSGAAPLKTEPVRSLSVEPPESGFSGLGGLDGEALNLASKEREGSSVPVDVDASDKTEKPERKHSDTEHNERRSRRKYRSRSKKHEEEEDDDNYDHDGKEEDKKEDKRDRKHSRKKHRSHHSSHHSRDGHKHRKRQSSSKDQESRHRHKHGHSDDEHWDRRKRNKKSHSEREADLEEGEISTKSSDQSKASVAEGASREASVGLSNSHLDPRPPSQPSDTTQVSDDLRAKIRAMLLATL